MNIIGLIPARGGSHEIKDKNIYPLCGKPMIEYTIEAAKQSKLDDWFVFTDKYTQYRTLGIERLEKYSQGEYGSVIKWLPYAIEQYETKTGNEVDAVCLLQPTSPLRAAKDIDEALDLFVGLNSPDPSDTCCGADSLYSGYYMRIKEKEKTDNKNNEPHFQRNGSIFIMTKELIKRGRVWGDNPIRYVMPKVRSVDVDTMEDLVEAEIILKGVKLIESINNW